MSGEYECDIFRFMYYICGLISCAAQLALCCCAWVIVIITRVWSQLVDAPT